VRSFVFVRVLGRVILVAVHVSVVRMMVVVVVVIDMVVLVPMLDAVGMGVHVLVRYVVMLVVPVAHDHLYEWSRRAVSS
jgi:hypothetical protein